jgi:NAD+ kinase
MLKKILIFGKIDARALEIFKNRNFKLVKKKPDLIASFGGDGTLMRAEYAYPGVPKIILRNSSVCKLCSGLDNNYILEEIEKGHYSIEEFWKIQISARGKRLFALNDAIIHNADPRHAIRYRLFVDGREIGKQIIGDGIVVATPLGSTGYYRSITDSYFEVGLGLAFNNSTEQSDHIVLREDRRIEVVIIRGPALVYADNQKEKIRLGIGDKVTLQKSFKTARIVKIN